MTDAALREGQRPSEIRGYFLASRPEIAAFLPTRFCRTLEIGCGAGGFTRAYLGDAQERWGIEPDPAAARGAAPAFTRLLEGTYDAVAAELPDGHFDLVICNDVIEHMPDHDRFLRDIRRKMAPGGAIVGSIPNIRHLTALIKLLALRDFPYSEDGILDRTHLRFFTKKSLERAFRDSGFSIDRLEGIRSIIREGVTGLSPAKNLAIRGFAAGLVGVTLGAWADTQYPQFGFRVRVA